MLLHVQYCIMFCAMKGRWNSSNRICYRWALRNGGSPLPEGSQRGNPYNCMNTLHCLPRWMIRVKMILCICLLVDWTDRAAFRSLGRPKRGGEVPRRQGSQCESSWRGPRRVHQSLPISSWTIPTNIFQVCIAQNWSQSMYVHFHVCSDVYWLEYCHVHR